jgi:hypothetical protein
MVMVTTTGQLNLSQHCTNEIYTSHQYLLIVEFDVLYTEEFPIVSILMRLWNRRVW